jgi:hypothetical protein
MVAGDYQNQLCRWLELRMDPGLRRDDIELRMVW